MSVAALEVEANRLQAENDRLRCALIDVCGQIVCGRLTGDLPDNFLEQFSQLPDRPLVQVLRFLPARQVPQMRLVSRKFNQLIRKCSKTMPKKEHYGSVLFKSNDAGLLTVELFDSRGYKIIETMLSGYKVALWELLRFIRFDGLIFFGKGLSATSEVLHHLSKAWLTIRPEVVIFAGDLSQTSRDSLRAFLVKVEPSIKRLHFQRALDIPRNLLSDDLICAAGRLDGLMVVPDCWGEALRYANIGGDETLLSMVDTDHTSSYFFVVGFSGFTPGGIRAFVEKWKKKWMKTGKPEAGAKSTVKKLKSEWNLFELSLHKCANVTQDTVEAACGRLLKKEWIKEDSRDMNYGMYFSVQCRSSNRRLEIHFDDEAFRSHYVNEPRPHVTLDDLIDDDWDSETDEDDESDDDSDFDYDDEEDMNYPEGQSTLNTVSEVRNMASQPFEPACGGVCWKYSFIKPFDGKFMELIFVVIGQFCFQSVANLEAKVARVQAENDRLRRSLGDVCGQISGGRLTGELPDNFLEQFSQLPDRPLEQVLRFLPAHQVAQMRHVSRKFNNLIKKCSNTMPKKQHNGSVLFKINLTGQLTVGWFDDSGKKISTTQLVGDNVALSELLRFIRIDGLIFFGRGLSATDAVLDHLSKAWLTIRPEMVIFAGDLSQTSRDSLKTFLVKVEPSIKRLHFQNPNNIADSLLSDDVIGAAGRLDGLMVMPWYWGSELHNINIGDQTMLSLVDADHISLFFIVTGCSGITPAGIRAFIEKWMKKEKLKPDGNIFSFGQSLEKCALTFDNCANVTEAAVEEACGDLLKKEMIAVPDASSLDDSGEMNDHSCFTIDCPSTNRHLEIRCLIDSFISLNLKGPRVVTDDDSEQDIDEGDHDEDEDDDEDEDVDDDDDDEDDEDEDHDDEDDEDSDLY